MRRSRLFHAVVAMGTAMTGGMGVPLVAGGVASSAGCSSSEGMNFWGHVDAGHDVLPDIAEPPDMSFWANVDGGSNFAQPDLLEPPDLSTHTDAGMDQLDGTGPIDGGGDGSVGG